MVHGDEVGVLGHGEALLRLPGDVQLGDEELDGAALDEDGEEDHDEGGEEEDVVERLLGGDSIENKFGLSLGLKNGLRFPF